MEIKLDYIKPLPMAGAGAESELWNREVCFSPGSFVLVKARSGQGKTTLLSVLYGLRQDYQGQVCFNGQDIRPLKHADWSRLRTTVLSYVFQDLQLFEDLTARQNAEIKNRLTTHKTASEIDHLFETLGLAEKRQEPAARLSLGQRQRVAIIRALCQPFEFLLLDEPFSHLDEQNRRQARDLIWEECRRQKAGLIITSLKAESELECPIVLSL